MSVAVRAVLDYQKKLVEQAKNRHSEEEDELKAAKIRLTNLQADKIALELKERELDLVSASEVEQEWNRYIYACKSRLLSMPSKLAYQLAGLAEPAQVQAALQIAIDEALIELGNS